ncbi:MAG: methylenetetrahydrofolate reductase C-terminal domain-containing protein [Desulfobacterota bacterium]|nr:methylenetetrahydrofolate reductase C-terminal domain-containing protein [Thermodesulfobacteriota bacterium]
MASIPFRHAVKDPELFCVTWEQVPGKGAVERQQEEILSNAEQAVASGRIHALGVTDNPGGNPSLSVELLCAEMSRLGIEPVVHFACRDKNRNAIESLLYGLERCNARNLLVVSGDYPSPEGFCGTARPVFDLDPVHVVQLISAMNTGLVDTSLGRDTRLTPTNFFAGVAVSPFKKTEAELYGQYSKLLKKIKAGAQFAITQIGFDPRKFHELILWLRQRQIHLPVLANLFVLTYASAKFMTAGNVPGAVIPPALLTELAREREYPDKGMAARLLRAARFYSIMKGLGYAGVHIGGHNLTCDMVVEIIQRGEELYPSWQDVLGACDYRCEGMFYYCFHHVPGGFLNSDAPVLRTPSAAPSWLYRILMVVHRLFFDPSHRPYRFMQRIAHRIDRSPRAASLFGRVEHLIKTLLFRCADCGDCALPDTAYLCPMSECAKFQRNGPCGGSTDGWCEVYPRRRQCLWVRVYKRMPSVPIHQCVGAQKIVPPCDWRLWQTSSWLNYFLGRDHNSKMLSTNGTDRSTG